ncbi:glycine betaine ABC transporter substrate-binding protein, partial [Priestia megaterium]
LDAYATDPEIKQFGLKVLKDDQQFFPPYQGAPVLREDTLKEHPELKKILNQLGGKISDGEMREMNYQVNAKGKPAEEVAHQFLVKKGLIKK